MSTRDESVPRGASIPTTPRIGDHAAQNGPYTAPSYGNRTEDLASPPVVDRHVDHEFNGVGRSGPAPVTPNQAEERRDRVRWGPIWAGTAVVLTVFIVLQLLLFAFGASGATAGVATGVLALVAFFVGGLTAGASTMWRNAGDGLLHGVLVWALSLLGILALALIGGSALLGPLSSLISSTPDAAGQATQAAQNANIDPVQALNTARHTAGWTALALGAAVAAAALGGTAGSKIWPGRKHTDTTGTTGTTGLHVSV